MSEYQIKKIMKRLDEQDELLQEIKKELAELRPVKEAFTSVMGFDKVIVWLLKFLAMLGAGIGVLVVFIKWLRG